MSVLIGHASCDENRRASGGKAGDQTGREVCIRSWYNANWDRLIRAKSPTVAEKMARFVEDVCKGNYVGYDQGQRNTLRDVARAANWDGSKIKTKCETDCSAFMTVAAEAAGIAVKYMEGWNAPVTQTMCPTFKDTGAFEVFSDSKYLTGTDYLKRGDILVRQSGHTAMVLSNGKYASASISMSTNTSSTASSTTVVSTASAAVKTVDELAKEVLAGKWGSGETRKEKLTAAGYDYDVIQAAVNRLLSGNTPSIERLAMEVLAGQWGSSPDRERLLSAAGYDAAAVQQRVNEMLRGGK